MLALIQEVLEDGRRQEFPMTRLVANMEWALEDRPGVADIVEYESRLNYILPKYDDTVVCTYDLGKFSASAVMDILRTHPMVIVGEVMQENPFYTPPDELLPELAVATTARARHSAGDRRFAEWARTDASPDVGALRRCISDVVALSTLVGRLGRRHPARRLPQSLAQVLQETLGADVVYVGLRATASAARVRQRAVVRRAAPTAPSATRSAPTSPAWLRPARSPRPALRARLRGIAISWSRRSASTPNTASS